MDFCPACGMLLQIQPATGGHRLRLFCPTCPYVCPIKNKVCPRTQFRFLVPRVFLLWCLGRVVLTCLLV
uniref:DNA-directed RNA polymerase II subunit RPB9-like zinc ribbon domain-containing protein n=1 Tax=Aegilops tauschii subsp. strangulata TaxID=200361 RepID=A0A453P9C3_AEGTS